MPRVMAGLLPDELCITEIYLMIGLLCEESFSTNCFMNSQYLETKPNHM